MHSLKKKGSVHLMFIVSLKRRFRERVKGVLRHALYNPDSPAGKLLLRNTLRLFLQRLPGRARGGASLVKRALSQHPCWLSRPYGNTSAIFSRTSPHLTICVFCLNSKKDLTGSQFTEAIPPVRLKIDEALTADRGCPQGCGRRGRPAWTQARPRPDRQAA